MPPLATVLDVDSNAKEARMSLIKCIDVPRKDFEKRMARTPTLNLQGITLTRGIHAHEAEIIYHTLDSHLGLATPLMAQLSGVHTFTLGGTATEEESIVVLASMRVKAGMIVGHNIFATKYHAMMQRAKIKTGGNDGSIYFSSLSDYTSRQGDAVRILSLIHISKPTRPY